MPPPSHIVCNPYRPPGSLMGFLRVLAGPQRVRSLRRWAVVGAKRSVLVEAILPGLTPPGDSTFEATFETIRPWTSGGNSCTIWNSTAIGS
jgi:hypothetical protein